MNDAYDSKRNLSEVSSYPDQKSVWALKFYSQYFDFGSRQKKPRNSKYQH